MRYPSPARRAIATARSCAPTATLLLLSGCRRSPDFSILGSFFPGWLFCTVVGVLLAFLLHLLLLKLELHEQLSPPLLVYPAVATCFSLALWLLFFG